MNLVGMFSGGGENFWTRKARTQKAIIVMLLLLVLVLGISSLKIPKAILNTQRSATKLCVLYTFVLAFPIDLPSQIFHLFSN